MLFTVDNMHITPTKKSAPAPLTQEQIAQVASGNAGGVAPAQQVSSAAARENLAAQVPSHNEHIEINPEHVEMSLRDLMKLSREVRMQREELDKQQKSIDECITVKHHAIAKMRDITKLAPEDADDVLEGLAELNYEEIDGERVPNQ